MQQHPNWRFLFLLAEAAAAKGVALNYNDDDRIVTPTPTTEVVALVLGNRSKLKPNARIFIPGATKDLSGWNFGGEPRYSGC
jgi:hypothetical protein